jgi:hypothetical protein
MSRVWESAANGKSVLAFQLGFSRTVKTVARCRVFVRSSESGEAEAVDPFQGRDTEGNLQNRGLVMDTPAGQQSLEMGGGWSSVF